jgi:hypothetical protein
MRISKSRSLVSKSIKFIHGKPDEGPSFLPPSCPPLRQNILSLSSYTTYMNSLIDICVSLLIDFIKFWLFFLKAAWTLVCIGLVKFFSIKKKNILFHSCKPP